MKPPFLRLFVTAIVALQLVALSACTEMFYSDAQNSGRKSAESRQAGLASMKVASAQAVAADQKEGQELVQLLVDNTHIQAYRKRTGDRKPYLTAYDYYAPDGTFVARDTHSRRDVNYQEVGTWKVDGKVLCVTLSTRAEERCYTIRVAPDGAIQYWIHRPGDPFDGLFSRNVTIVRKGLQQPEYISDPAAFR